MLCLSPYQLDLTDKQKESLEEKGFVKILDYSNWKKHHFRAKTDFELIVRQVKTYKKEIIPERGLLGQSLYACLVEKEPVEDYIELKQGFMLANDPLYLNECLVGEKTYLLYLVHSSPTMKEIRKVKRDVLRQVR